MEPLGRGNAQPLIENPINPEVNERVELILERY
jgi:hypothetical protein